MQLVIETLKEGNGCGYLEDKEILVPKALPQETIEIQEIRRKKHKRLASILRIKNKSKDRVRPKCKHFHQCAGCQFQHLKYAKQLTEKQQLIQAYFPQSEIAPSVPSRPFFYRSKLELSFFQDDKKHNLGFFPLFGRKVFDLKTCLLFDPWIKKAKKLVKRWWKKTGYLPYHLRKNRGTLRNITFRTAKHTKDKMVVLQLNSDASFAPKRKDLDLLKKALCKVEPNMSFFIQLWTVKPKQPTRTFLWHYSGKEHLEEELHLKHKTLRFFIGPTTFFQPNIQMAEQMFSTIYEWLIPYKGGVCLDLYCGIGTISLSICDLFQKVYGVELNKEAILDANVAKTLNHIQNVEFLAQDAKTFLREKKEEKIDVVIIDPPRCGLDPKSRQMILEIQPKAIVYLACNPKTQKEDIEMLSSHYKIEKIQPFDQFPNTHHVENLVLMN